MKASKPKPLGPARRPRIIISPHFSPGGEAKCMRGLSVRGARCSEVARASWRAASSSGPTLPRQSVEHGEQAQRSNGGPLMCLARQPVRNAG